MIKIKEGDPALSIDLRPAREKFGVGDYVSCFVKNEFLYGKGRVAVNYYQIGQHCHMMHTFIEALLSENVLKAKAYLPHFLSCREHWEAGLKLRGIRSVV